MFEDFFEKYFDDTHRQFRATCKKFAEKEIAPNAYQWEEAEQFDRELYRKAANAGILGISFPEQYGGGGGDIFHSICMSEELIRGGSTGTVVGLGSLGIGLPPILDLGTEEQKTKYIPSVMRGDKIAALAITEPGAGSDVAGVSTSATRNGDHYIVNGTKIFITSGVRADVVSVLTRTGSDPHGGLTFFVMERGMPGFSVSRALKKTGWRASDTAELSFDNVRVPVANRLGPEGSGFLTLMKNFQNERLGLAIQGYVIAEICLEEAIRYARERQAFGKALSRFQVTRHKLADMATKVFTAKTAAYECASRVKSGQYLVKEMSMAKNYAAQIAQEVSYEAVQIFGGSGYMRETLVERLSRDARLLPIGGGTQEIMNEIIAKMMQI
ncbi:MAG: acyl-CoA dehydrogenase family protein [Chrysiogenetes bacterium]|nr:acyl-CoA dehydrogenase family protein [Chrysiogenetes bacterium]